jgi:hypothetical protein
MRVGSCRSARGVVLILIFKQYDCSLNLYDMGKGHVLYFGTRRRVQKTIWIQIVVKDTVCSCESCDEATRVLGPSLYVFKSLLTSYKVIYCFRNYISSNKLI